MSEQTPGIPAEAAALAASGKVIEAIKVTREQTGLSLKDAKDAVDAHLRDPHGTGTFDSPRKDPAVPGVPELAILALEDGRLIDAITHTREATGLGLKDAKETVERYLEENPGLQARFKAAASAEFRRVAGNVIVVLALLSLAVLSYQYFTGPPR